MKKSRLLMAGLASLIVTSFCAADTSMADIYKHRCANCHGTSANGVPKLEPKPGVTPNTANAQGMASEAQANIYGPPLNHLSKEEILHKLKDFRNKGFDAESYHSVMRENLKTIEAREGKVADEEMAEYISTTFGQ